MFSKIATILLVAIFGCFQSCEGKYAQNVTKAFFSMPQTLDEAVFEGWTEIEGVDALNSETALAYYGDPRIILLYSECGTVAGWQISIPVSSITDAGVPIDYADYDSVIVKNLNGTDYYTGTVYFGRDGATRYIRVQGQSGLTDIPTTTEKLLSETSFLMKSCVEGMGIHYYQINANTTVDSLYPWFLVSKDGKNINGIGFQVIGPKTSGLYREWFEDPTLQLLVATIPDAPTWIGEFAATYGIISFHLWFDKSPQTITCE